MAVNGGHTVIVRYLVEKRADINVQDKSGVSTMNALLMCT